VGGSVSLLRLKGCEAHNQFHMMLEIISFYQTSVNSGSTLSDLMTETCPVPKSVQFWLGHYVTNKAQKLTAIYQVKCTTVIIV
jgi:hypothetical protein